MSEVKYTKDGKKVAVLGRLNSEESIVQEIFVSGDQEVPAGENFVAKGLLDQPLESWKEKTLREMDERFDRLRAEKEKKLRQVEARLADSHAKAQLRASALFQFTKNADSEHLRTLEMFMAGEITHFFVGGYHGPKIVTWEDDELFQIDTFGFGTKKIEAIKLISICGASDGNLHYRVNQYSDGSGLGSKPIIPCASREEALGVAQDECDRLAQAFIESENNNLWFNTDKWKQIGGIVIPKAAQEKVRRISEHKRLEKIEKLRSELAELESKA